jgi:CubicO group peptidase (beta-lactamase class C family)
VGLILERATGMPVSRFMEEELWKPMDMEADGSWSLDSTSSGLEKAEPETSTDEAEEADGRFDAVATVMRVKDPDRRLGRA